MPDSAPAYVVNSTPVALTPGVSGQVPYPSSSSTQLSYVEVVNSSPYAVIITQGGVVLGQVPAFTAQVFPLAITGQPLGYTALVPGGLVIPGQDTTLYLTWCDSPPYGQWPASVGSSAIPFSSAVITFANPDGLIAGKPTSNYLTDASGTGGLPSAWLSTLGFAGLFVKTNGLQGGVGGNPNNPYRVVVQWATDALGANLIATREFIVSAGVVSGLNPSLYAIGTFGTPHFGNYVRFFVVGPASGVGVLVTAEHRVSALSVWLPPDAANPSAPPTPLQQLGGLVTPQFNVAIANGATLILKSLYPFEGPTNLHVRFVGAGTAGQYTVALYSTDEEGTTIAELGVWQNLTDQQFSASNLNVYDLIVPATALSLQITNGSGGAKNHFSSLTPDLSRIAA